MEQQSYPYSFSFFLSASFSSEASSRSQRTKSSKTCCVCFLLLMFVFLSSLNCIHRMYKYLRTVLHVYLGLTHTHTLCMSRGHLLLGTLLMGELQRHSCSQLCATQGGARAEITQHHGFAPIGSC